MEALLEKEGDVENWNDDRLDELSGRVDAGFKEMREGFARVDREMKEGFAQLERTMKEGFDRVDRRFEKVDERFEKVDERFEKVDERFFKLMVVMLVIGGGMISALIAAQI